MAASDANNYVNTIIFCVVCNLLFVGMIVLLFVGALRPVTYLLVTVELCLLLIILHAIIGIYSYEQRRQNAAKAAADAPIPIEGCPEYYVRRVDKDNKVMCDNRYTTPDNGDNVIVLGDNNALSVSIDLTSQVLGKRGEYVCQEYRKRWAPSVPWMDMEAHCETI